MPFTIPPAQLQSRGNNVFGFEDLPNNIFGPVVREVAPTNIFGPVVREILDPDITTTS